MDYQQAEQALLLGVLDAFPCPVALLNRHGSVVYSNGRPCPAPLEDVDFPSMQEIREAVSGEGRPAFRTELAAAGGAVAAGIAELYPVRVDGEVVGVLFLFRPDPAPGELSADALPAVSDAMNAVWARLQRLSLLRTPALFIGEPGTGKQDFARALHRMSSEDERPFMVVRSDALPENLRDAAHAAGNGTLFCERIDTWPELLLAEAENLFTSRHIVRGLEVIPIAARLMVSAGPEFPSVAGAGDFPPGLYARVNIMPVHIPPLRDRPEDIVSAAERMASVIGGRAGKEISGFSEEARRILASQDFPQNLLQLRRVVEDAVDACPGGVIGAGCIGSLHGSGTAASGPLRRMRADFGRDHARAMVALHGNTVEGKRQAASELGISLSTLYRILGSRRD